jgi:hypothetical protein
MDGFLLQPLLYQAPLAFVALVGMIVSLAFLHRAGSAAVYALVGSLLLLLASAGFVFLQFVQADLRPGRGAEAVAGIVVTFNFLLNLLRALAVGLMMVGVFAGRRPPVPQPFD